ncbi:MAG: hypothetical protein LAE24_08370 [Candidatus Contendobacter sp.]|nr:hypothetical protein [Candidatus Contendobacter sp.]
MCAETMYIKSESEYFIPIYSEENMPEKPGLYFALFHGRKDPDEEMDEWGLNGPIIGPLKWGHTTYGTRLHICFETEEDELRYFNFSNFPEGHAIDVINYLIPYAGFNYGDWTFFIIKPTPT